MHRLLTMLPKETRRTRSLAWVPTFTSVGGWAWLRVLYTYEKRELVWNPWVGNFLEDWVVVWQDTQPMRFLESGGEYPDDGVTIIPPYNGGARR